MYVNQGQGVVMTDTPMVSILTPVLNGVKYLEPCILSVLNQSCPYVEHIFVDGCSTDGTVEMLSSYSTRYPERVRFISEPDSGPDSAANKGLQMAKGRIIGFLGSDDMSEPDALMKVVDFFRLNPEAYFVFGECNSIDERGKIISKKPTKDFDLDEAINDNFSVPTISSFVRRQVIDRIGMFDTNLPYGDSDFLIRIGKEFKMYRVPDVLANFRTHENRLGRTKNKGLVVLRTEYLISRRHGGRIFSPRGRRYFKGLVKHKVIEPLRLFFGIFYRRTRWAAKRICMRQ